MYAGHIKFRRTEEKLEAGVNLEACNLDLNEVRVMISFFSYGTISMKPEVFNVQTQYATKCTSLSNHLESRSKRC